MPFKSAKFITGAPNLDACPPPTIPEFCFAGRSNVGKSSLINKVTNKRRLARTSNTPGKTQQMNYYSIDDSFYIVDLPGFGFAKVPKKERERWGKDIQHYLLNRDTLQLVLHLVDSRHPPTQLDEDFFFWMASNGLPFSVLLTKADKISNNKLGQSKQRVINVMRDMNIEVPVIPCSAETGRGIDEIRSLITEFINPKEEQLPG
ncbi:ribosome biogenesis GTP-binding protein YihA/YsxC [Rhodohalobacter sp. 8-1]|uniref:ribosome biogenesis GTP-binding protein YihA/YsxC n=1 Tax=Rhodohalobacter sp. 8-1 TaxID=3131972 RepID=UPI0030EBDA12